MYLEHFRLRTPPFRTTPDPRGFFPGAKRGATLEALIYAVTHDEGIVKISGESGSGKTMLCQMLRERLPPNFRAIQLVAPALNRDDILDAIGEALGIHSPESAQPCSVESIQACLAEQFGRNHQVVVIIDEAHALSADSLEEIGFLSNMEANGCKLLHLVLFGQPELDERVADASLRPLRERITHNFALEPLLCNDVGPYLKFRIGAAGYHGQELFTPAAIKLISQASEGVMRRINILADKALLSAYTENKQQVDHQQIQAAIRDTGFLPVRQRFSKFGPWSLAAFVITILTVLAASSGSNEKKEPPSSYPPVPEQSAPAPSPAPKADLLPETSALSATASLGSLNAPIEEYMASTEEWLRNTPDTHYFIQLLRADASKAGHVEDFLEKKTANLDPTQIRIYRSRLSGRDLYGVIYGDFENRQAAQKELQRITRGLPDSGYYIRSVSKLR